MLLRQRARASFHPHGQDRGACLLEAGVCGCVCLYLGVRGHLVQALSLCLVRIDLWFLVVTLRGQLPPGFLCGTGTAGGEY